jgi:hypothetical protein
VARFLGRYKVGEQKRLKIWGAVKCKGDRLKWWVFFILCIIGKRQLKIAKGMPLADVLVRELENFRVKVNTATGHDSYEAWSENEHDDLVFALSIACW